MFGVKLFHKTAKYKGIKPILGCEVYVAANSRFDKTTKEDRSGRHLVLLAKNLTGYQNLMKLVSYGWTEGFYYRPRIDKELLFKYSEGLIVSTACLAGPVSRAILNNNIDEAEKIAQEYKNVFGDDFYLELQRHFTGDPEKDAETYQHQVFVNKHILEIAKKLDIKYIATNDVHYINADDAEAHDILICLSTGKDLDDPKRMRYSGQEFLKTPEEMAELFADIPEAIANTKEIADKIEEYELNRKPIMPDFPLPEGFTSEADYLRHLTYEAAKVRWKEITPEIQERIDFELNTIIGMGFPGYFLIVWDFIRAAREMGVSVGPGRGSAAGSVVAYCLRITEMDPIKYKLLFERFLNPDRISMPDIDIDFDEDGREKVLKWVVEKYGKNRVANVITFGSMAAKSSIKDVARVQRLPLSESDRLSKMVPSKPGTNLKSAFAQVPELTAELKSDNPLIVKTLKLAQTLEGSIRQTGVHACGIIIGRDDLTNYIPISTAKDSDLFVTQYDGKHVEDVGMLKMDFLGLTTLSIIKDTAANIKLARGIDIDIDNIPLDDPEVFKLFSKGETTAIFQFESDGMKKHLKGLKPTHFDDLIAMNALYRPGPMDYIPSFIARKNGHEKIEYDLPEMKEFLEVTYGVTVYQEQVMLLSQKLAGFTKGQADSLRKAMGKKIKAMMDELREKFVEGAVQKGHPQKTVEKIWTDWEAFAQYAFNKSHSTCYAFLAYQTGYLKAYYPAEFMAAVLNRSLSDIDEITLLMDECRRMNIQVLGPDVNESYLNFMVNKKGEIRFGLAAVKGVGEVAVREIIAEREKSGPYSDYFNFVERVNLTSVNKRNHEALATAGGFDSFETIKRSQYLGIASGSEKTFIEECIVYGNKIQGEAGTSQASIFGGTSSVEVKKPEIPIVPDWDRIDKMNREKALIGMYLSEHPLDDFKIEIQSYCTELSQLNELEKHKGRDFKIAGIITTVVHATTKTGNPYGSITVEDFTGSFKITLFGKDYLNFKAYFTKGYAVLISGKVQHRFNDSTKELEFKVNSFEMLADAKNKMLKSLSVKVPIENLTKEFIDEFTNVLGKHKGNADLKFMIYEPGSRVWVEMFSRNFRVDISNGLIDFLNGNSTIEYKIS
jgi:DNA polymerase-3 subunit alpha